MINKKWNISRRNICKEVLLLTSAEPRAQIHFFGSIRWHTRSYPVNRLKPGICGWESKGAAQRHLYRSIKKLALSNKADSYVVVFWPTALYAWKRWYCVPWAKLDQNLTKILSTQGAQMKMAIHLRVRQVGFLDLAKVIYCQAILPNIQESIKLLVAR